MSKTLTIDYSPERLINLAQSLVDDRQYIMALKMLRRKQSLYGNDDKTLMLIAEVLDDLQAPEACINAWYYYLQNTHTTDKNDLYDAYEGMAINYARVGEDSASKFYFKLMYETGAIGTPFEDSEELAEQIVSWNKPKLRFCYPPELADYSREMQEGIEELKHGNFYAAISKFEVVPEGNKSYLLAQNHIIMCKIILDKLDEAYKHCQVLLSSSPNDVRTLVTYAAVLSEMGKKDESIAVANQLMALNVEDSDDLFKIATVCCENGMHRQAFELISKLVNEFIYDFNIMYFKGVSAFNCGEYDAAIEAFNCILAINPYALITREALQTAKAWIEEGVNGRTLSYFYRMSDAKRNEVIGVLKGVLSSPKKFIKDFLEEIDVTEWVCYALDECVNKENNDLLLTAVSVLILANQMDVLSEQVMLNAFLPDWIKLVAIGKLVERDVAFEISYVIKHRVIDQSVERLKVGRKKRRLFVKAYSLLISRYGCLDGQFASIFADYLEDVYSRLLKSEGLDIVDDANLLVLAVFSELSKSSGGAFADMYKLVQGDADPEKFALLCRKLNGEE